MKLGDKFPESTREEYSKRALSKGAVLRFFSRDIQNPKIKRLIVIGIADGATIGKVYINTGPQSAHNQIKLDASGRDYLDHDSYADCSRIYENDYAGLLTLIRDNPSCYLGQVCAEDLHRIQAELISAKTIPLKQKRRFGLVK